MHKELQIDDHKPTANIDENARIAKIGKIDTVDFLMMLGGVGLIAGLVFTFLLLMTA